MNVNEEQLRLLNLQAQAIQISRLNLNNATITTTDNKDIIDEIDKIFDDVDKETDTYTIVNSDLELVKINENPEDDDNYYYCYVDKYKDYYYIEEDNTYYSEYYQETYHNLEIIDEYTIIGENLEDYFSYIPKFKLSLFYTSVTHPNFLFENENCYKLYITRNEVIDIKEYKYYDTILKQASLFYKESNFEFGTVEDFKFGFRFNSSIKYLLVVKFDDFIIKNTNKIEHNIKDLYIVIPFTYDGVYSKLYGFRESRTIIEYNNSYSHSHLHSCNDKPNSESDMTFCLGSGHIVNTLVTLQKDITDIKLGSLFATLIYYVKWESLEGRPYMYIANLMSRVEANNSQSLSDFSYILNFLSVNIDKLKLTKKQYLVDIDEESVYKLCNELIIKHYVNKDLKSSLVDCIINIFHVYFKDNNTNTYFKPTILNNTNNMNDRLNKYICKFKGQDITTKLIETNSEVALDYTTAIFHPYILNYARQELVKRINDYLFEKEISK